MSDERRKLWLYLYPDEPQQKSAIETIEEIPQRQRSDFFRDSIVAGIALSKLDKRLPALVSMLLQQDSNIDTLIRILKILFPKLDIDSTEDKSTLCAVAWQKRCRDELQQGTPWSAWFAISEDEYNHHLNHPESNSQVRALWAYDENEQKKDIQDKERTPFPEANTNTSSETLSNAKKLFGNSN